MKISSPSQRVTFRHPQPANSTLKLARPGFGPALKRLGRTNSDGGTPPATFRAPLIAARTSQPPRRASFGTRALAVQLSVRDVSRTKGDDTQTTRCGACSVPAG